MAAGPLHDIGVLHVDPQILDPDTALTPRQRRQWHPHPLVSTAMVARHDVYPPRWAARWASTRNAWSDHAMPEQLRPLALTVSGLARETPQEGEAPAGPARGDRVARVPSSPR